MPTAILAGGFGALALLALLAGPLALAVVVVGVALLAALDLSALLRRDSATPIVPAALVPAVGLPLLGAIRPQQAWDEASAFAAGAFVVAVLFVLLFGRRRQVAEALGATMLVGLLVGLGATTILLLRDLPDGFRWVLGLGALVAAAELGPVIAERLRGRSGGPSSPASRPAAALPPVAAVAVVLALVARPPFDAVSAGALALLVLLASITARAVFTPSEDGGPVGALVTVTGGLLLSAPVAYVLARAVAL